MSQFMRDHAREDRHLFVRTVSARTDAFHAADHQDARLYRTERLYAHRLAERSWLDEREPIIHWRGLIVLVVFVVAIFAIGMGRA